MVSGVGSANFTEKYGQTCSNLIGPSKCQMLGGDHGVSSDQPCIAALNRIGFTPRPVRPAL
jgi:hypothetical protein